MIYCTLGNFLKPLPTNNLPKSPLFLSNFCKGVKNFKFFLWHHFWAIFTDIWQLFTGHTDCVLPKRDMEGIDFKAASKFVNFLPLNIIVLRISQNRDEFFCSSDVIGPYLIQLNITKKPGKV